MAYCKKCGAYIPDNMSGCLACGYDESAAAAQAQQQENERRAAEERRRQKQEEDKRWAEAEYASRQRQQEQERRWAEADAVRRQREREARQRWEDEKARRAAMNNEKSYKETYNTYSDVSTPNYEARYNGNRKSAVQKLMGVLSYCGVAFLIPLLACKDDEFAQYHAKQGLRLFAFDAITTALTAFVPVAGVLKVASFYFMIKGIGNVVNEKTVPLPYIGEFRL